MARIRIVDEWLRSPVGPTVRARVVMVVAENWGEQKVLMRAYASCSDQSQPMILLHGNALAIGPAGLSAHGPWGLHLDDPREGRAQQLRDQLELAARRVAGTRAHPPRLADEHSTFDRQGTGVWLPGAGPRGQSPAAPGAALAGGTPVAAAPAGPAFPAASSPHAQSLRAPHHNPEGQPPRARRTTPFGWSPAAGPGRDRAGPGRAAHGLGVSAGLAAVVGRTMPLGFRLDAGEWAVLDLIGRQKMLPLQQIAAVARVEDPAAWMDALVAKLTQCGLDMVARTVDQRGELTYTLRV
jgi:hypothetical protein